MYFTDTTNVVEKLVEGDGGEEEKEGEEEEKEGEEDGVLTERAPNVPPKSWGLAAAAAAAAAA